MDNLSRTPRVHPINEDRELTLPPTLDRRVTILLPPILPSGTPAPCLHPILGMGAPPLAKVWNVHSPLPYLNIPRAEQPLWLDQPATYPPLDFMTVQMESGNALRGRDGGGNIVVFPEREREVGVSVRDVLSAVEGFYKRMRGGGVRGSEMVGRRDARRAVWLGLEVSERERDAWVLHVV